MKQKLLTDIELDVHGLKYLMDLYSKEPTPALLELLKQNIQHIQGCLGEVMQELDLVQNPSSANATATTTDVKVNKPIVAEIKPFVAEEKIINAAAEEEKTVNVSEEKITNDAKYFVEEAAIEETSEAKNIIANKVVSTPVIESTPFIDETSVIQESSIKDAAPIINAASILTESPIITESPITDEAPGISESPAIDEDFKPSVLGESIRMSAGLRQSISLNDSFRFSRELFGGDIELMNRVVEQMSVMSSYKSAAAFLTSKIHVTEENEALNDLLELLKKFFNQTA